MADHPKVPGHPGLTGHPGQASLSGQSGTPGQPGAADSPPVEEVEKAEKRKNTMRAAYLGWLVWLIVMIICTLADAVVWAWMLGFLRVPQMFEYHPSLLALLHLACIVVVTLGFLLIRERDRRIYWVTLVIAVVAVMPAVGIILMGLALIAGRPPRESSWEDDFAEIGPQRQISHPIADRIDLGLAGVGVGAQSREEYLDILRLKWLDVQPVHDILMGKDPVRKRNAIHKIADRPSAQSMALLRQILEDPDREIRFAAGSALGRIEKSCTDTLSELKQLCEGKDVREHLKSWEHLAAHFLFMADLKIGTVETQNFYRGSALKVIESLPEDLRSLHLHVVALAGLHRYAEVLVLLASLDELDDMLTGFRCDALLQQGDYRGLITQVGAPRLAPPGRDTPLAESLNWWNQPREVRRG